LVNLGAEVFSIFAIIEL